MDKVWNTLIIKINLDINRLAPSKIIQLKKIFVPYMTSDIQESLDKCDEAVSCEKRKTNRIMKIVA